MTKQFDYDELLRATESFSPARLIGKGSHGSVFIAKLPNDKLVAVKKPLHGLFLHRDDINSKLQNEIRILSSLAQNRHVIGFLGTCKYDDHQLLVMEFMPNGSLHDLLHVSKTPPSWPKRVEIAMGIARAVRFLHDESRPSVVHRDIKSENVLFDSDFGPKLADFGLAVLRHVDDPGQPAGTIGYLDPCYTTPSKLSSKNDAFSFGVLLLEILSGKKVIDLSRDPACIVDWALPLIRGRRVAEVCDPRVPLLAEVAGAVGHLLCVAASCVSLEEGRRPSMSDVVSGFECRFLERDRFGVWMGLLRGVVLMRRRHKMAKATRLREKYCNAAQLPNDCSSNRKVLLRDILEIDI